MNRKTRSHKTFRGIIFACLIAGALVGAVLIVNYIRNSKQGQPPRGDLVDTNTWEVIPRDSNPASVAALNTPELKAARQKARFKILHPELNARTNVTAEEQQADADSLRSMLHPAPAMDEQTARLKASSPEELDRMLKALNAIQHPTTPTAKP